MIIVLTIVLGLFFRSEYSSDFTVDCDRHTSRTSNIDCLLLAVPEFYPLVVGYTASIVGGHIPHEVQSTRALWARPKQH